MTALSIDNGEARGGDEAWEGEGEAAHPVAGAAGGGGEAGVGDALDEFVEIAGRAGDVVALRGGLNGGRRLREIEGRVCYMSSPCES